MSEVLDFLSRIWKPTFEIGLFWYMYFVLLRFLRSTGALQILRGLLLVFVFFVVVRYLKLETITRLMGEILPISVIAVFVLFQSELRRGLTRIGQSPMFKFFLKEERIVDEIVKSVSGFSRKKVGALIALEREVSLQQFAESGVVVDAILSFELLSTIFMPNTALHDGGVIIQGGRVQSAGCLFPLSQSQRISKTLGTRHRAAVGVTEETDAIVIVVSEETGTVSVAERGELNRRLDSAALRNELVKFYFPQKKETAKGWLGLRLGERKNVPASQG